jgi:hypothetical protein
VRLIALACISLSLTLTLAGCGSARDVTRVAAPQSSGILVWPRSAVEPACNGGRGISLDETTVVLNGDAVSVSAALGHGSVVLASNNRQTVVVRSLTSSCTPDASFGENGVATVKRTPRWMSVQAVTARRGGGVILVGLDRGNPVVGELDRHGKIIRSFGDDGLARFPFCGWPTSVLQEPSGRILVSGDGGMAQVGCGGSWIAAMSEGGEFDEHFGFHGSVEVPTYGADSGVGDMTRLSNGNILVAIGFGNSGCWGYTLRLYTPSGWEVPGFAEHFEHFWRKLGLLAFSGTVYADGRGFTIVGTGQRPCWVGGPFRSRSATGLVIHFWNDGLLAGPVTRFASGMHAGVGAFPMGGDIILDTSPYADGTKSELTAIRPDGSVDERFGSGGRVRIRVPWKGPDDSLEAGVSVMQVSGRSIFLVATNDFRRRLRIIKIRPFSRGGP